MIKIPCSLQKLLMVNTESFSLIPKRPLLNFPVFQTRQIILIKTIPGFLSDYIACMQQLMGFL